MVPRRYVILLHIFLLIIQVEVKRYFSMNNINLHKFDLLLFYNYDRHISFTVASNFIYAMNLVGSENFGL